MEIWFLAEPRIFQPEEICATRLGRGQIPEGQLTYYIEFDEAGLTRYLDYWFGGWARQNIHLEAVSVDLKPGGLIIYGDVNLGIRQQRIGTVFNLDASGRQFVFAGVDIEGQLLAALPAGPIAKGVAALEANGKRALRELRFIDQSWPGSALTAELAKTGKCDRLPIPCPNGGARLLFTGPR